MLSCAEALQAVSILKKFVTYEGLNDQKLLNSISMIDQRLESVFYENYRFKKQSKITNFCKPITVQLYMYKFNNMYSQYVL